MSKSDETKKVLVEEKEEIKEEPVVAIEPQESKVKSIWKKIKKPVLVGLAIIISGAIGYGMGSNKHSNDSENTFNEDDFIEVDNTTES
jgi:activator of 2-hydroxyglutaryl-CoA dehydratase